MSKSCKSKVENDELKIKTENKKEEIQDVNCSDIDNNCKDKTKDEIQALKDEIEKLTKENIELKEKVVRLLADFDNFRKRVNKEKSDIRVVSQIDTITSIIPVLDHFDLALSSVAKTNKLEVLVEGLNMIKSELERIFSSMGIETIDAIGQEFDPNIHDAISEEYSNEFDKGIVMKQWRKGYKLGDRVIRPASVIVSNGSKKEEKEEKEETKE